MSSIMDDYLGSKVRLWARKWAIITLLIQLLLDWYQDDTENKQQIIRDQSTKCPREKDDAASDCLVIFTDDG